MSPILTTSIFIIFILLGSHSPLTESRDRHVITFRSPGVYPEGLTWDPVSEHFIVGSLRRGTFHSISDAGVTETLTLRTPLPENSTILGLAVDKRNNRLLAAINSADSKPYLASFSLHRTSLSLIFLSPLPTTTTSALANGVAVDPYGNAYVTNSGENFIWKVDVDGGASIFSNSSLFTYYPMADPNSPYNYCGINGIAYVTGKGYLLAVQSNTGKMFRVDVANGAVRTVNLPADLTVADGIAVRGDGVSVVVSMNCAWLLKSDDSWSSAVIIDEIALDREGFPTSVTIGGGGRVYVVYGYAEEGMKVISQEREEFRVEEIRSSKDNEDDYVWAFVLIGLGFAYFLFWRFQMGQLVRNMDKKHN